MPVRVLAAILFSLLTSSAFASSHPTTYSLPWGEKTEQLTYRSCGCADSCWVAELRERKSKRLKAVLRCDCSNLHGVYPADSSERDLQESCSEINDGSDKMHLVSQTMKRLIGGAALKTSSAASRWFRWAATATTGHTKFVRLVDAHTSSRKCPVFSYWEVGYIDFLFLKG